MTFRCIYNKESLIIIEQNIRKINILYILICLLLIGIYFICQGTYIKCIMKTLNKKVSLKRSIFYSIVEFFYSGITPSSTGGQPVQLYYMTKDKIPLRKSYITLILNTVFFKMILLILGIVVILFHNYGLLKSNIIYIILFILGFLIDLTMIILGFLLIFKTELVKKIYIKTCNLLKKQKFFRKKIENKNIDEVIKRYSEEIIYIKTHKRTVVITFLITFIQRMSMFSIIYVIYRALGYNEYSYFTLISLQISVQVAVEAVPFPGGVGVSEGMLHNLFVVLFSLNFADVGMLLTRTFTFYIPLIMSGLIILYDFLKNKIKEKRLITS